MQKITSILLTFISLLFLLVTFASAQGGDTTSLKGPEPTPGPTVAPTPTLEIDPDILRKIEPQLLKQLLESGDESASFIVYMKAQTAVAEIVDDTNQRKAAQTDSVDTRTAIVDTLQQTAHNTQQGVLELLNNTTTTNNSTRRQGMASSNINSLWIINAVAAAGSLDTVLALAARSDVEVVRLDKEIRLNQPVEPESKFYQMNPQFPQISQYTPEWVSPEWGVSKIRADLVHNALGIDGSGIVVANIDSGVDGFHPALQSNYRGYTGPGKLAQHTGNWFDATGGGATYPVDANGHGTHTMGTAVGQGGIGVAPGAQWIAVKTFDSSGTAQLSWLHTAFQWVLAPQTLAKPNGDPSLAPNIVNNSWGNDNGYSTEFQADVQALLAAGIYPVFSAGNNGSSIGSVGSPGSYPESFAVGATSSDDQIAIFSSRGPSPWGQIKPDVSAPGKDIRSSLPGGAYGNLHGTSMAAPHVSGLAALLMQASPALTSNLSQISTIIKSTAIPLGNPSPNNDFGWGRVDAYNAVLSVASVGTLQGTITQQGSSMPISGATVQMTPHGSGSAVSTTSNGSGYYLQGLAANTYDATASAFAYQSNTAFNLVITNNTTTTQDFSLLVKATGILSGTIKDKNTLVPLAATISIEGTPIKVNTSDGNYNLTLPIGTYTATVVAAQHRISKSVNITINDGATVTKNFLLDTAPTILLVDSGAWYQESKIEYYQQALTDLLYTYATHQIKTPFNTPSDIPSAATLNSYDIVIWSAPLDSPGYIQANEVLESYLADGGKLLLSGQDIAYYDGGGFIFGQSSYLKEYLKASYLQDDSGSQTVNGPAGTPWAELSFSLSGGDGADNQQSPDSITNTDPDFADTLLAYDNNQLAGLHIGLCVPYRALYLPFGFEGINSKTDRNQVMNQAIDWLMETPAPAGVEITPPQEALIGNFASTVTHTLRLRNTGTNTDTLNLVLTKLGPYNWSTSNIPASVELGSCQTQDLTVEITMPITNTWHISDTFQLSTQSTNSPAFTDVATRTTKTPAPVLLVDDDRWYSFADEIKQSLANNNIPYDYWYVPKSWSGPTPPSPPLDILQWYPMVVWYTAYDWYQPLTSTEEDRLTTYLNGGGRLFFSSQDYLYNNLKNNSDTYSPFAQNYLGVQAHIEDYVSTSIIGQADNVVGTHLGPYSLTFPAGYRNWTDALAPTATTQVATVGQAGQVNGLTKAGVSGLGQTWHTNFLSYGPELLDISHRTRLMQRSMGWLSWLGSSTVVPSVTTSVDGQTVGYTATVTNNGWHDLQTAHFTATFPPDLTLGTYSAELTSAGGNLIWDGALAQNQSKIFTYSAVIADSLPLGTTISQTNWLAYPDHNILFDRIATVKVNFPDLTASTLTVTPTHSVEAGDILTYTLVLKNIGVADAPMVTTTNTLSHNLDLLSVNTPSQGSTVKNGKTITWTTSLSRNTVATLTYQALINYKTSTPIKNTAYANDDISNPVPLTAKTLYKTIPYYLPIITKNK